MPVGHWLLGPLGPSPCLHPLKGYAFRHWPQGWRGNMVTNPWDRFLCNHQVLSPRPLRAEPFRAEPFRAEPFRAEPFRAEPFRAEPFRAEPFRVNMVTQKSMIFCDHIWESVWFRESTYKHAPFGKGEALRALWLQDWLQDNPRVNLVTQKSIPGVCDCDHIWEPSALWDHPRGVKYGLPEKKALPMPFTPPGGKGFFRYHI